MQLNIPHAVYNAFMQLCEKWENFHYDKVIKHVTVDENGDQIREMYFHEWVDPNIHDFYEYITAEFLPNYASYINSQEMTETAINFLLTTACYQYRVRYTVKGEHSKASFANPREDGSVDEVIIINSAPRSTRLSRTSAQVGPLEHTKYWLL